MHDANIRLTASWPPRGGPADLGEFVLNYHYPISRREGRSAKSWTILPRFAAIVDPQAWKKVASRLSKATPFM